MWVKSFWQGCFGDSHTENPASRTSASCSLAAYVRARFFGPHDLGRSCFLQYSWHCLIFSLCGSVLIVVGGCSREQVDQLVEQVKDQTQSASESLSEEVKKVIPTGEIRFSMGGDIVCPNARVTISDAGDGRPVIVQIKSYEKLGTEKLPSVLIHATAATSDYSAIVGKTLTGEIHVNLDSKNNQWQNSEETKANIIITSNSESELVGQVTATMKSVDGRTGTLSGSFRAIK